MLRQKIYRVPALEILEDRTVPATLVNASTLTYQDIDGDSVKVTFSKPLLNAENVNSVFGFTTSGVTGKNTVRQAIRSINLNALEANAVEGLNLSVVLTRLAVGSDGQANVNQLYSWDRSLGSVVIQGDLGTYQMRGVEGAAVVQYLQARTLGKYQNFSVTSFSEGRIGTIKVVGDVFGEHVHLSSLPSSISSIDIGGSVRGSLEIRGNVDRLKVEKDVTGNISLDGGIKSIYVGGSIVGGSSYLMGSIQHVGLEESPIDQVYIRGSIRGGSGDNSGSFFTTNRVDALIVGGNVAGGLGVYSGQLVVNGGASEITVRGDVKGGAGRSSGMLSLHTYYDDKRVDSVTVKGNVVGGSGQDSGSVAGNFVNELVIEGNVVGSRGNHSGHVKLDGVKSLLQLNGKLQGGAGNESGSIRVQDFSGYHGVIGVAGDVKLLRGIVGGSGNASGICTINQLLHRFSSGPLVGSTGAGSSSVILSSAEVISIEGDIKGGTGSGSGSLSIAWAKGQLTETMAIDVRGDIIGSKGDLSGWLTLGPSTATITVHGSVIGSEGYNSGLVEGSSIGTVEGSRFWDSLTIQGSVLGGTGPRSGFVQALPYANPVISAGPITIGKNLQGGSGETSGFVYIQASLDSLTINGNMDGGIGRFSGTIQANNLGFLSVDGNVRGSKGFGSGNTYVLEFLNHVSIAGHLIGGTGELSGQIYGGITIESVVIGGSIIGGIAYSSGGILAERFIGSVQICGDVIGHVVDSGFIGTLSREGDSYIDTIQIAGSIRSGQIYSTGTLGTISVAGSISGTAVLPTVIQANGVEIEDGVHQTTLETLVVGKDISFTNILVGTTALLPDGPASVGTISIGRNWKNSNLIVGFGAGADGKFGTTDDVQWNQDGASTVDSLFIAGSVLNATGTANHYLQAGEFLNVLIQNTPLPLQAGSNNDNLLLATRTRLQERFI